MYSSLSSLSLLCVLLCIIAVVFFLASLSLYLLLSSCPLSHMQLLLEKERDQLNTHAGELESIQQSLEKQVATYQGQLTAEQTKNKALETSKKDVCPLHVHVHVHVHACILHVCVYNMIHVHVHHML